MSVDEGAVSRRDQSLCKGGSRIRFTVVTVLVTVALVLFGVVATAGAQRRPRCGKRAFEISFFITNGALTLPGDWPWHAAIVLRDGNKFEYICGGTIINKRSILTAAHCVQYNATSRIVHVGGVNLNEMKKQQGYNISRVLLHPKYDNPYHDIAVLKLSTDIEMSDLVQPICLWDVDDNPEQLVGQSGTVVGFGYNERGEDSVHLQHERFTVKDNETCIENDKGKKYLLTSNVFCAGGKYFTSPCNGDAGGGFYAWKDGSWYTRGIVSFGAVDPNTGICDPSKYTVFTTVSRYLNWIQSVAVRKSVVNLPPCSGTVLRPDDSTCNAADKFEHGFLLLGTNDDILRVPLNGRKSSLVSTTDSMYGIDRDCADGRLYWRDHQAIFSANYKGSDKRMFVPLNNSSGAVAVDWISRRLYWTDEQRNTIEVASLDDPGVRAVVVSGNLENPRTIVVDPLDSKLYWSQGNPNNDKIECSNLDGSERRLLLSDPQIKHVTSMHLVIESGELCYSDEGKKIECIDPSTGYISSIASNLTEPTTLAANEGRFYWTEHHRNVIESINQDGVHQKPFILPPASFHDILGMTAVTDVCPLFHSPCAIDNGDCPEGTICLANPEAPGDRSCVE